MGNQPLFVLRGYHSLRYFLRVDTRVCIKNKEEGKDQESIQYSTTRAQLTLWESDKSTRKHHIQRRLEVSLFSAGDHKAARHRQSNMQRLTQIK